LEALWVFGGLNNIPIAATKGVAFVFCGSTSKCTFGTYYKCRALEWILGFLEFLEVWCSDAF
jgi:hypothetical protein